MPKYSRDEILTMPEDRYRVVLAERLAELRDEQDRNERTWRTEQAMRDWAPRLGIKR